MRAIIQRVTGASVIVNGGEPRVIGPGLVILLGVRETDTLNIVPKLGGEPEFIEDIDSNFVLLKLVPDLDPSIITFLQKYKKVIIEGYGSGGIPIRLEKVVQSSS